MTFGFPSRRSRVQSPSSASGAFFQNGQKILHSSGIRLVFSRRSWGDSTLQDCGRIEVVVASWLHGGAI